MQDLFRELDFSETEALAFLALAEAGKASATQIAKNIEVPRSSAYSVLQSLLSKGVVAIDRENEPVQYLPLPPESLLRMVSVQREKYEKELEAKELAAKELEQLIKPFYRSQSYTIPRIQFFEGKRGVEEMLYANHHAWQESISKFDNTWWGYQDHQFVEKYRSWLDDYWGIMQEDEKILLLSNLVPLERSIEGKIRGRTIKQLPVGVKFSSTIWVLGEYVVLIMTRQTPHYAFQLKDAVFAANQRTIFQFLWNSVVN